jgi:hypothetical protein
MKKKFSFFIIIYILIILLTFLYQCSSDGNKNEISNPSGSKISNQKPTLRTTTPSSKELASIVISFDGFKFKRIKGDPLIKDNSVTVPYASSVKIKNNGMNSFYVGSDAFEVAKGKEYLWKYADGQLDLNSDKKVLSKRETYCYIKAVKF